MSPELFRDILSRCDQELFNARQKLKYGGFFGRRYRRDQLLDWTAYSIQTILRAQSYLYSAAAQAIEARRAETLQDGSVADESAVRKDAPQPSSGSST